MKLEDLLLLALTGAAVFLFVRQPNITVVKAGPTTPQGTSYPIPGATSYIDPQTGKIVVCPSGQVAVDVGDLAPWWTCGAPGTGWVQNYGGQG